MHLHMRAALVLGFLSLMLVARTARAAPVISEVCWMGSDLSTADEWLELAHTSDVPLDIGGWTITSLAGDATERVIATLPQGMTIASDAPIILSRNPAAQSRLAHEPALISSAISLPNTKLLLRLYDASGSLVDTVDDGVGAPFAGRNATGSGTRATMERIDLLLPGTLSTNWRTAESAEGIDEGAPLLGSPGVLGISASDADSPSEESTVHVEPPVLRISEVLANPPGSDDAEWIEVQNIGNGPADLETVQLAIGSKTFALSAFPPIDAGEYLVLRKADIGFTLPNSGGELALLTAGTIIDSLAYPEAKEGISFGRIGDAAPVSLCAPSEGAGNSIVIPDVSIGVQSVTNAVQQGTLITANGKTSLNLEGLLHNMAPAGALCSWNFGDGFTSASCNPAAHTFSQRGAYTVLFVFQDACGTAVERELLVQVLEPAESYAASRTSVSDVPPCIPDDHASVMISEFLPNPEGEDGVGEWIELHNHGDQTADLCGWMLDDGEGGSLPVSLDAYAIAPDGYLFLSRDVTEIALNNDADIVRLLPPAGGSPLIVEYADAPEGQAFAHAEGSWFWTEQHTPGSENVQTLSGAIEDAVEFPADQQVEISAVYPVPADGEQEWIELRNKEMHDVSLESWKIDDIVPGGSRAWNIPAGYSVPAQGALRIPRNISGVALNDAGDTATLLLPNGAVRSTVVFGKIPRAGTWRRDPAGTFCRGTPADSHDAMCPEESASSHDGEVKNEQKMYTELQNGYDLLTTKYENIMPQLQGIQDVSASDLEPSHRNLSRFLSPAVTVSRSTNRGEYWFVVMALPAGALLLLKGSLRS